MHRLTASTHGEELCQFLFKELNDGRVWQHLEGVLRPMGDAKRFAAYYQHHAAVFLTCKLIAIGKACAENDPTNLNLLSTAVSEHPWNRLNSSNRLLRLLSAAIQSSGRSISSGTIAKLKRFAIESHSHCYICGRLLDFQVHDIETSFSAEHLWPSSYGGDSVEENLLPACKRCNSAKGNSVSWVSTDVHSLFVVNADEEHLSKIEFRHRYAVFNRFAFNIAMEKAISLKQAFMAIGPWAEARLFDTAKAADMFNIKTHADSPEWEHYEAL